MTWDARFVWSSWVYEKELVCNGLHESGNEEGNSQHRKCELLLADSANTPSGSRIESILVAHWLGTSFQPLSHFQCIMTSTLSLFRVTHPNQPFPTAPAVEIWCLARASTSQRQESDLALFDSWL